MQENNDIEILLSEPQTAVLSTRAAVILDMAGQGSGKSQNIGYSSGMFLTDFPEALGFIGANTYTQLSQSTLVRVFQNWRDVYGLTEYDAKSNPAGAFVVDKRPPAHFVRMHYLRDYEGTISFYNGALVFIGSLENYKAHDGKEFAWAHLDETKDTKEEALKEVIIGRLRQYGVWYQKETGDVYYNADISKAESEEAGLIAWNPLYIHTSPALGGVDWINKMFKLEKFAEDIKTAVLKEEAGYFHREFENKAVIIYSTHHNSHNLPPNYIENQKANLLEEDKILKLVYGYPFAKSGGEWFPFFRKDKHVRKSPFKPGIPIHQTWDFNATPYVTLECAQIEFVTRYLDEVGNKHNEPKPGFKALEVMIIWFYKEYCLLPPQDSTEATCHAFAQDHTPGIDEAFYYGDGSGLSRIPGMGSLSNFKIVESNLYMFFHNDSKKVKFPNVAPFTRRDLLNKIFAGQIPTVEIYIDPDGCPNLVEDCELVKKGPKGKLKETDKDPITKKLFEKRGHPTDAMEYLVSEVCKHYIVIN